LLENGEKVPAAVIEGDQVMFDKYAGTELKFEG
ncbi:MAG: co-chaperone GroES, partial [Enterococcus thailandicus]|nr:co-chaperone GroES [Enterococcus thailandicus]